MARHCVGAADRGRQTCAQKVPPCDYRHHDDINVIRLFVDVRIGISVRPRDGTDRISLEECSIWLYIEPKPTDGVHPLFSSEMDARYESAAHPGKLIRRRSATVSSNCTTSRSSIFSAKRNQKRRALLDGQPPRKRHGLTRRIIPVAEEIAHHPAESGGAAGLRGCGGLASESKVAVNTRRSS